MQKKRGWRAQCITVYLKKITVAHWPYECVRWEYVQSIYIPRRLRCWGFIEKALVARRWHIVVIWPSIFVADYIDAGKLDGLLLFVGVAWFYSEVRLNLTWLDLTWVMLSAAVVYKSSLAPEQTIRWKLIICLCVIIVLSFKCFCLKILLICNVYCCWKGVLLKSFKLWRSSNSKFHDVTAALWQKVLSTCYN